MLKIKEWERKGRPLPPPHVVKQQTLFDYAEMYGLKVLVETGTLFGDMIEAMMNRFDRIYSIELSKDLFERAKERFKEAHTVELIHGDSGNEIRSVLNKINEPALFWLDGHYSGESTARGTYDTPISNELKHILGKGYKGHVIIIDDARCFGTSSGYPTIDELKKFIWSKRENLEIVVQDDSIRITPK